MQVGPGRIRLLSIALLLVVLIGLVPDRISAQNAKILKHLDKYFANGILSNSAVYKKVLVFKMSILCISHS